MSRAFLLRISLVAALSVLIAATPKSSFAQHGHSGGFHGGGFGGNGGFHGGGFGSHGGGGFGGFRQGGGLGGFHSGDGFRGGFGRGFGGRGFGNFGRGSGFGRGFGGGWGRGFGGRGFNRFGHNRFFFGGFPSYGYGLAFNFGFFPYWGYPYWGYPYFYGYPGWGASYSYPYSYPYYDNYDGYGQNSCSYDDCDHDYHRDRRCRPDYRYDDRCNDDNYRRDRDYGPSRPSGMSGRDYSDRNYVMSNFEDYRSSIHTVDSIPAAKSDYQFAYSSVEKLPSGDVPSGLRPAVRNAIQTLRAMPPDARARQLSSDRYGSFSPQERALLSQSSQGSSEQ
jgi:hypothetical protein